MKCHTCSFCNFIDNFYNFIDNIMGLIDEINTYMDTYIDELTHIRCNNQYLLLFYESRTHINVKIIDTILVNIGQLCQR